MEVRALATFAEEEAKHIHLFKRFAEEFAAGFKTPCGVIGPATEVAKVVLSHSKLGVALLTLHIEWMTQAHYIDSVKDNQDLDPQFKSLLRHHWMEESQHAKIDTLLIEKHARAGGKEGIAKGIADFATLVWRGRRPARTAGPARTRVPRGRERPKLSDAERRRSPREDQGLPLTFWSPAS